MKLNTNLIITNWLICQSIMFFLMIKAFMCNEQTTKRAHMVGSVVAHDGVFSGSFHWQIWERAAHFEAPAEPNQICLFGEGLFSITLIP